jgi:type I restriction enzyme S subunit
MKKIKLKDLFEIKKGKKVEPVDESTPNKVRYIQIEDLRDDNNIKYCFPNDNYVYANSGSIIIAWDGANAGTVSYGLEGAIGSTLAVLESNNKDLYIPYVGKYLQSKFNYFRDTCTGATIPHISRKALEDLLIPVPSFEKQMYISNMLDKAKSLVDKRKAQIEALDQLTQSVFLEMFGDPIVNKRNYNVRKLSDLCIKITDGTHHSPPMVKEGIPYITAKHLGKGYLDFYSDPTYISVEDHQKIYSRCNPIKGDVLYIKDGATTGIAGINHYDFEFSMLSSLALIKVEPSKLNNYYLVYYLNNRRIFSRITSNMSGGAIKRLTIKKISDIDVVVPPIDLQNKFSELIVSIEQKKALFMQSLEGLQYNFHSLMQRAFKGELFTESHE